ncbi:MAG TPA: cytochrome-c peroxidase, partial [Trueperaceae bacterium]|nr:cytochrome-c peroxidase [Trueperaceae bacterium]
MKRISTVLVIWLAIVGVAVGVALAQGQGGEAAAPPASATAEAQPQDPLFQVASGLFAPLPEVVDDAARPVTDEKVELGKMLWYDTRLSLSGGFSCNSCHNLATYGVDNLPTSLGHGWAIGPRNAPTALNAALHATQFWDGRAADVEAQAQGPILN